MSLRLQLATGTLLLLAVVALMTYAITALQDSPYVLTFVLLWLAMVEYAAGRAWWVDVRELRRVRR